MPEASPCTSVRNIVAIMACFLPPDVAEHRAELVGESDDAVQEVKAHCCQAGQKVSRY